MISILTAPTTEPVTSAEAADAARVDGTTFASILPGLIKSARQVAEQETCRQFITQVWRVELDDWPAADDVLPFYRPTALAVTYWDGSSFSTLATNLYAWASVSGGFSVAPTLSTTFPTLAEVAIGPRVRIDVTVGGANAAAVDECVKTYIKAMVAHWLRNPEASQAGRLEPAPFLGSLLDPARVYL